MKKIITLLTVVLLVFSFASVSASASGYYLGDATFEDIATYINHYPIDSYNFNGMSLVRAEDLEFFGFDVSWNEYSNSLTIARNPWKNKVDWTTAHPTVLPSYNSIGIPSLEITTTDVSVYCGGYRINAYGGLDGYTLINIENLTLIDNISAAGHPEVRALKIWVEDGLDMSYEPIPIRRFDATQPFYLSCDYCEGPIDYYYDGYSDDAGAVITMGPISRNDGFCINCDGGLYVTDVIDANGNSRRPYWASKVWGAEEVFDDPTINFYAWGFTDVPLTKAVFFTGDDLEPSTSRWDPSGWVEFEYNCYCTGDTYTGSLYFDVLPQ